MIISKEKKIIFFFISSYSGGKGGHYYSLLTIAQEIENQYKVVIINIGHIKAEALNKWNGKLYFIKSNGLNFKKVINTVHNLQKKYQPILLHSFDVHSALFARKVSYKTQCPYLVTKCGGPPPSNSGPLWKLYYPSFKVQTVFNDDDFQFFKNRKKCYKIKKIKQRVSDLRNYSDNTSNIEISNFLKSKKHLSVIRVGRIGAKYYDTIVQSINLVKFLNKKGIPSRLAVIGYIESEMCLKQLREISTENIQFFTNDEHTYQASRHLIHADISIGTGRNFMESCACRCLMFTPVKNSKYPAFVTKKNFKHYEKSNFSERSELFDPNRDVKKIIKEFNSVDYRNKIKSDMRDLFDSEFNVKIGVKKYFRIYQSIIDEGIYESNHVDIFIHAFFTRFKILKSTRK